MLTPVPKFFFIIENKFSISVAKFDLMENNGMEIEFIHLCFQAQSND